MRVWYTISNVILMDINLEENVHAIINRKKARYKGILSGAR